MKIVRIVLCLFVMILVGQQNVWTQESQEQSTFKRFQEKMPRLVGEWTFVDKPFEYSPYCFRIKSSLGQDGGYYIEIPCEMEIVSKKDFRAKVVSWDRGTLKVSKLFDGDNGWGYSFSPTRFPSNNTYTVTVKKKKQKRGYEEMFKVRLAIRGTLDEDGLMYVYVQYWDGPSLANLHDIGMCRFVRTKMFDIDEKKSNVTFYSTEEEIKDLARNICIDTYLNHGYTRYHAERMAKQMEEEMLGYAKELKNLHEGVIETMPILTIGGPLDLKGEFQKFVEEKIKESNTK